MKLTRLALFLAASSFALAAQAHHTWLLPSSTVLSKAQWITVDAAVANDLFYFNHQPLALDNLSVSAADGRQITPENLAKGKLRSVFDLNLEQSGTYRLAVYNSGVFANYKLKGEAKRWRGTAAAFASEIPAGAEEVQASEINSRVETFVTVGKPTALKSSGKGLELAQVTPGGSHPNDLYSGEAATFRLLLDGQPAAGLSVTVTRGASRYRNQLEEIKVSTDSQGQFTVRWPQPGTYRLESELQDQRGSNSGIKARRVAYAATLEVLPQ